MPKKNPKKTSSIDFEKSLDELESIVDSMEKGELSLEDSLAYFEKGVSLARDCQQALSAAEQKVDILMHENGASKLVPFESDSTPDKQ